MLMNVNVNVNVNVIDVSPYSWRQLPSRILQRVFEVSCLLFSVCRVLFALLSLCVKPELII